MARATLPEFGSYLRSLREAKNLSQQDFAVKLEENGYKVSQNWVAQLELGRLTNPTKKVMRVLALALDHDYGQLLSQFILEKYDWVPMTNFLAPQLGQVEQSILVALMKIRRLTGGTQE